RAAPLHATAQRRVHGADRLRLRRVGRLSDGVRALHGGLRARRARRVPRDSGGGGQPAGRQAVTPRAPCAEPALLRTIPASGRTAGTMSSAGLAAKPKAARQARARGRTVVCVSRSGYAAASRSPRAAA